MRIKSVHEINKPRIQKRHGHERGRAGAALLDLHLSPVGRTCPFKVLSDGYPNYFHDYLVAGNECNVEYHSLGIDSDIPKLANATRQSRFFKSLHLQISASLRHPHNPVVFFDVVVGSTPLGRILVEVFAGPNYFESCRVRRGAGVL